MDWNTHEEDVWFEFRGSDPQQLTPGRYYKGTVDGFADFGVFVDLAPGVTGLLHRSELDRRLESLDWDPGDTVFVQVKNVRDNGNIDLAWSIRQSEAEFRGARVDDPDGEDGGEPIEGGATSDDDEGPVRHRPEPQDERGGGTDGSRGGRSSESSGSADGEPGDASSTGDASADADVSTGDASTGDAAGESANGSSTGEASSTEAANETTNVSSAGGPAGGAGGGGAVVETERPAESGATEAERVPVGDLDDLVGETVRLDVEVVGIRQTGGPTIFEVRDETGTADVAAFVEAGVRAYPDIEVGDAVRIDGEVERRRGELQVESESVEVLEGDAAEAVAGRLEDALAERARPEAFEPLADHEPVAAAADALREAATAIRRAVFDGRPVVVRHAATADGYVAGAALERAVLPLVREEHAKADAEYHYFDRRPLDDAVYSMEAATNDATRMLSDRERFDEQLPLVVLAGVGSTVESTDGLGLLGVYGAERAVVDAAPADDEVAEEVETLVDPTREGADAEGLTTGALAATLAAGVNADVRDDLAHLPATSYWEDAPAAYVDLAAEAGYDPEDTRRLREAVALEAYYQSYEDKRELVRDLLFDDAPAPATRRDGSADRTAGDLVEHVSEQFREKLDAEIETAEVNLERRDVGDLSVAVLDADAYTHRYDFPPTDLLADELHRRNRGDGGAFVTVALDEDDLYLRSTADLGVRETAEQASEYAPDAGIGAAGVREGRIEFLSGEREAVVEAVIRAVVEELS
ncbi:MAG: OB-fold nucleic acid binding domain-containing protein [Haloferacaceae archaeon]